MQKIQMQFIRSLIQAVIVVGCRNHSREEDHVAEFEHTPLILFVILTYTPALPNFFYFFV